MNRRLASALRCAACAWACALLVVAAPVAAQSAALQISQEVFPASPALPFAPPPGAAAPPPGAAAPPSGAAAAPPPPQPAWEVRSSDLRVDRTLERWAQAAGWRLQWDAARHVEIGAPTVFRGSFAAAVRSVLGTPGIRLSEFPLEGCLYPNEPPLLRITRQGEQLGECPQEYAE